MDAVISETLISLLSIVGVFVGGFLLGYSYGIINKIKEYEDYLDEMETYYNNEIDDIMDKSDNEGDWWKR